MFVSARALTGWQCRVITFVDQYAEKRLGSNYRILTFELHVVRADISYSPPRAGCAPAALTGGVSLCVRSPNSATIVSVTAEKVLRAVGKVRVEEPSQEYSIHAEMTSPVSEIGGNNNYKLTEDVTGRFAMRTTVRRR